MLFAVVSYGSSIRRNAYFFAVRRVLITGICRDFRTVYKICFGEFHAEFIYLQIESAVIVRLLGIPLVVVYIVQNDGESVLTSMRRLSRHNVVFLVDNGIGHPRRIGGVADLYPAFGFVYFKSLGIAEQLYIDGNFTEIVGYLFRSAVHYLPAVVVEFGRFNGKSAYVHR